MNRSLRVSLWAVAALLSACGGGGGSAGGSAPPPPPPGPPPPGVFNLNAAWKNLLSGTPTNSWSLSGTASNGNPYTIQLSTASAPAQVFPLSGTSYSAGDATAVVGVGNLGLHQTVSRSFFDATSYVVVGTSTTLDATPSTCSIANASVTPPASATVGTSGALQTFTDFDSCVQASAQQKGTTTTTWSLEADGTVNLFCLNSTVKDKTAVVLGTESDCFEVAQDGTLGARARVTSAQSGITLVAKNY